MAEFDVKTISCSSKITAKIKVNISSLEHEYDGNKLEYRKIFTIDSGKGSNYTAKLDIYDFGQQKQVPYPSGDISRSHQKGFGISVADVQKLCLDTKIVFNETISKNFHIKNAGKCSFLHGERKTRNGHGRRWILDDLITEKFKSFKGDITVEFEPVSQIILNKKFKNFGNAISIENLYDVIKAANDTKDDELMSKAAEFIKMNPGTIEENPEWDDFFRRNPECGLKILKLNMFLKK